MDSDIKLTLPADFYPRPPRGGRHHRGRGGDIECLFLSTPSARRATRNHAGGNHDKRISIHALREEGDPECRFLQDAVEAFLSTPSARRATAYATGGLAHTHISIHALREEGDRKNREKIPAFIPL